MDHKASLRIPGFTSSVPSDGISCWWGFTVPPIKVNISLTKTHIIIKGYSSKNYLEGGCNATYA